MLSSWLSPPHHKNMKRAFAIVGIAIGVVILLLHVVANRLFSRMMTTSSKQVPSGAGSLAYTSRRMEPIVPSTLSLRPISPAYNHDSITHLFQDEFFSSPFMIDSELLQLKSMLMDNQMMPQEQQWTPLLRGTPMPLVWNDFDIMDEDHQVTVVVSVPKGISANDFVIEVMDDAVLRIFGGSTTNPSHHQSFEKQFALGRNMQQDQIAASLKDGTLTVTTPKVGLLDHDNDKKDVRRKIPIKEEL